MITILKIHLDEIKDQAKHAYPEECCGALLGTIDVPTSDKIISHVVSLDNDWTNTTTETRHRRFKVTAQDYLRLEKQARSLGISLCGFYHTHPDHPPVPSDTDLLYAWPVFSYPILSVMKGVPSVIKSYVLSVSGDGLEEEALRVI